MNRLKLVIPSKAYESRVIEYKAEMQKNQDSFDGCASLEDVENYSDWLNFED